MAQVNIRLDDATKFNAEMTLAAMGLTIPVLVNMLLKQVIRTGSVPFEITTGQDPFYSESNMKMLRRIKADADAGRNMHYHDIIEVDDDEEAVA